MSKLPKWAKKTKSETFCTTEASPTNYGIDLGEKLIYDVDMESLVIGVIGDWGVLDQTELINTTNYVVPYLIGDGITTLIENQNEKQKMQFIINCGDNFYDTGITSVSSLRWDTTFNVPFNYNKLKFYSVLGNHDWRPNRDAFRQFPNDKSKWDIGTKTQILYTKSDHNTVKNWCLPNYYYTFAYNLNHKIKIRFVGIDTQSILQYQYGGCQPENNTGEISDYCQGQTTPDIEEQLDWLDTLLSESNSYDYVVIFSHHFLVSRSQHGMSLDEGTYNPITGDLECVRDDSFGGYPTMRINISKIIHKYDNVQLYLAGHGHSTEAFEGYRKRENSANLFQTVIGRQGRTDSVICGDQSDINQQYNNNHSPIIWTIHYGSSIPSFATVTFKKSKFKIRFYDTHGKILWQKSIDKFKAN